MTTITHEDIGQLQAVAAIADTIKELGSVRSGRLYATCMSIMTLTAYERLIDLLVEIGQVRRDSGHMLIWVGNEVTT